ncbi:MAG: STAS domain-containing protein [Halomonas sp.]|uniref:STAS domain-containing protein n=1 Tax=Halomonas sp. TaxID=1486246 RepID=UPI00183C4061|nr:STAS domain-containing protein [Halomonas sp.]NWN82838.1 STAS domain-containing protein [Halomonas sp.]
MSQLLRRDGLRLEAAAQCLVVSGKVGFDRATELADAGSHWLAEHPSGEVVSFDLSGVADVSTAALSVLLEWARAARRAGLSLERVSLSPALTPLTDLAGLERLLPLEAAGD